MDVTPKSISLHRSHSQRRGDIRPIMICLLLIPCLCALFLCTGCGSPEPASTPTPLPTATASPTAAPTPAPTPTPDPTPVPVALTAFVPDPYNRNLVRVNTTIVEDSPLAILDELIRLGTLPDIDYGRTVYFEVDESYIKIKGGRRIPRVVARLDISDRLLQAFADMPKGGEQLCLQGLANTFLEYYHAETFMLTLNGVKLVTGSKDYESGFTFDQYAKTAQAD